MNRLFPTIAASLIFVSALSQIATAQATFTGAGGGTLSWFDPKNWDQAKLPTADDNAVINVPSATESHPVIIDNTLDPATKDRIARASRLMVGDGTTAFLTVKSQMSLGDGLRVGNSDTNHTGNGMVTQISGTVHAAESPQIGTTAGLTGTYLLQGGFFSVGETSLYIGGDASSGSAPGVGSFVISGGKFNVGSRIIFGNGGGASFTVIGSQAESIFVGDQFNQEGAGRVNLNVQIDKGGLTQISTSILGLPGITLYPSFAKGVTPYAGTWAVVAYENLTGNSSTIPVLGKEVDTAHWSAKLDTDACKVMVTYKP